ncbi:MAG: DUF4340 domain-containing protein [Clostridia bacterium]|nr:DUF4340 domain-containing protein [Clostridia bacterium]
MKKITAGIAAAVLLAAGIVVLMNYKPQTDTGDTPREDAVTVLEQDSAERITIDNASGSITLVNKDGEWTLEGEEEYSSQRVLMLAESALSYKTDTRLNEIKPEYGLDEPDVTVTVTAADGEHKITVGRKSAVSDAYFASADGVVFMMREAQYNALSVEKSYLTSFSRVMIDPDAVTQIKLVRGDETIELYLPEITRFEGNVWHMKQPYETLASDTFIDEEILEKLASVRLADKADSMGEVRALLTVTTDKDSYELRIGGITGDRVAVGYGGGEYYEPAELFAFADADTYEFMNKLVSYVNIADVTGYTLEYGGKEYRCEDAGKNKKLYSEIIGVTASGLYEGQPLGDTLLKVTFINAGDTVEYKRINAYTAAVTFDGKTIFTVAVSDVEDLINKLEEYFGGN